MSREQLKVNPPDFIAVSPQYTILGMDRETVMYRSGSRHIAFVGELYVELAALLDGTFTRNDIIALLCQRFDDTSVEIAVDELLAKGLAHHVNRVIPSIAQTAFNVGPPREPNIHFTEGTLKTDDEPPRIEYDSDGILKPPPAAMEPPAEPLKPSGPVSGSRPRSPFSGSRNESCFGDLPTARHEFGEGYESPRQDRIHRALTSNIQFTVDETRIRTSYANLKQDAIHPLRLLGVDGFGLQARTSLHANQDIHALVEKVSNENCALDWTSAWSMRQRRLVFVPSGLVYRNHEDFRLGDTGPVGPDSSGYGAGMTFDEAIFQACYDLIKRDSAALWWNNRIVRPGFDLRAIEDKEILSTLLHVGGSGRNIKLLDLTTDIGAPVVAAISADANGRRIAIGLGCHIDQANAVYAAIQDLDLKAQTVNASYTPWTTDSLQDHQFLMPKGKRRLPRSHPAMMPAARIKKICLEAMERVASDVIVVNLSRPETVIPCVRILAPGLCGMGMQFAIDRLRYGPVAAGWATTPSDPMAFNPVPYPFL